MGNQQPGPGWWLASDGHWYPPEAPGADPGRGRQPARRGISFGGWLAIAACVIYIVSPVDLLPEALLGPLGVPDDLMALLIAGRVFVLGRRAPSERR